MSRTVIVEQKTSRFGRIKIIARRFQLEPTTSHKGYRKSLKVREAMPASQHYRARAEECRLQAELFRDERAQVQMLRLANDYDRKAAQAETFNIKQPKA